MNIDHPTPGQLPGLRSLWKAAFGDDDSFLDIFFSTAFSPDRCRCITEQGQVTAALYWFEVFCGDQKFAYLYAIATDPGYRNRGLCRALVEDTKQVLKSAGFHGLLLVPQDEPLAAMYHKMGFERCTGVTEFRCAAGDTSHPLRRIDADEYARLRRALLPPGGVIQEGASLAFLAAQAAFYKGEGCLAAISPNGADAHCHELLGDLDAAPGILRTLGCEAGFFRAPGTGVPFAMSLSLLPDCRRPEYLGFCFD